MKSLNRQRILWPALTVGLIAVLVALGTLQYRWSNQVSEAATARMRAVLLSSMLDFRQDLIRELSNISSDFPHWEAGSIDYAAYAASIRQWEASSAHAGIIKAVYLVERTSDASPRLLKLNVASSAFEKSEWPPELEGLRDSILAPAFVVRFNGREGRGPRDMRHERPPMDKGYLKLGGFGVSAEHHGPPWFLDSSIPALIHPVGMMFSEHSRPETSFHGIIVELNQEYLAKHIFPELAQRYFPDSDALGYDVTVTGGGEQRRNLYSTNEPLSPSQADATLDLLGPSGPQHPLDAVMPRFRNGPEAPVTTVHTADFAWGTPIVMMGRHGPESGNWQLLVRNRQGSLEAVVDRLRKRNLALSFGILLVLAATMAMLIRASRGALRVAQLQMDFVAGVSHELRTPVAVISSAAQNIAEGVVQDKQQIARYGNAIRAQAAQLRQLIEQILLFASTRRNKTHYELRPAGIESVIAAALENTSELIREAGFRVETSIQPGLPTVMVNVQALSQGLQNLITNAVKYGGDAAWIGIGAAARQTSRGTEVLVTVSDRGIGIAPDELGQIFDAFYRGSEARAGQIHGSGLGLPLAKSMIEAMGGDITVESRLGAGSSFTIHLPASQAAAQTAGAVPEATINPRASYSKS